MELGCSVEVVDVPVTDTGVELTVPRTDTAPHADRGGDATASHAPGAGPRPIATREPDPLPAGG